MEVLYQLDLEQLTGVPADWFVLGLAVLVVVLLIILIVTCAKVSKLQKRYKIFMEGKNARSLEHVLQERMKQVERIIQAEEENEAQIEVLLNHLDHTYQKMGLVKYNAFHEMGGKLSFSLALLNRKNDGFILNAMHSREGCFTYIKEVIDGNSVLMLADEEREALDQALENRLGNKQ